MDGRGEDSGNAQQRRPGFGRFTRTQGLMGLAALGVFYWGAVGTMVGYRLDRASSVGRCGFSVSRPRPPHVEPMPQPHVWTVPPEPAWGPHPRPRILGLAYGRPEGMLVDLPGR